MSTYSPRNDSIFTNGFISGRISTPVISPPSVFVNFNVAVANFVSIIIHPSSSLCSPDWLTLSAVGHKHGHEMIRDGDNMYGQWSGMPVVRCGGLNSPQWTVQYSHRAREVDVSNTGGCGRYGRLPWIGVGGTRQDADNDHWEDQEAADKAERADYRQWMADIHVTRPGN